MRAAASPKLGLLLVDDDLVFARSLARELDPLGWAVRVSSSGAEALTLVREEPSEAVVIDLHLPGMDGLSLIERLRARQVSSAPLLLSAGVTVDTAVRAIRAGAQDVLEKPISAGDLDDKLRAALQLICRPALQQPVTRQDPCAAIMGDAAGIRAIREQIRTVARYRDLPVLINGETGTGKELVAQAIHALSETGGPFAPVNCAAIPEQLVESELFGHEAGSFTGARGAQVGLFEAQASGTLFLDEIGELPSALQPKLLRALESRSFRRVGGSRDIPFRARVISATHRNLLGNDAVLRSDLYYRLAGFTIATPALRDHVADIDTLARHFLSDFAGRYATHVELSPRGLEALHAYDWPGNVRELRAVVQQAAVLSTGGRVGVAELVAALRDRQQPRSPQESFDERSSGVIPSTRRQEPLR